MSLRRCFKGRTYSASRWSFKAAQHKRMKLSLMDKTYLETGKLKNQTTPTKNHHTGILPICTAYEKCHLPRWSTTDSHTQSGKSDRGICPESEHIWNFLLVYSKALSHPRVIRSPLDQQQACWDTRQQLLERRRSFKTIKARTAAPRP